ncbi:uncharacterized protein TEOVI_000722800 [Trypanosoma equiperdum]|uniref:FCP1 homology domain-containing protein n=4 Tax=Trypanozoon TaxID=39700 RepID=Q389A7_TRYB2|nr:hypothetical protein, conserved [Trypanosoma brucei gambiense DAL972]XP_823441.1 hypothetical protein, conserved [Trypanosoma brucei brucei TREU927]RHW69788.1 hypothetical protein DPX39_100130000 [Trypanosoma brucei equiperdum]SCU65043.1 hypothetical protein, conserved [Trypanosoma equiperdum]EAN78613.1 hypothetical protein, conserved [Trypanosoma brucei brucei TREU927]CBH16391.1 hypothetical protein, conserved [Trypanosoma brucei gambiense DAL972]|eukprot:XP_011778655.1 hypothetical protein, conserved [Trypanosoma brucei gambiense DAL972]
MKATKAKSGNTATNAVPFNNAPLKIVFLDCDGVVSPFGGPLFAPRQMKFLADIINGSGAQIVLSSSWRTTDFGRKEVARQLTQFGMPVFIDCTPTLPDKPRSVEILSWIDSNKRKYNIVNFVALDDINLPLSAPDRNFFARHAIVTNATTGLTEANVKQALQMLSDTNNI